MRVQEQAEAAAQLTEEAQGAVRRGALQEEAAAAAERGAQRLLEDNEALMADNEALLGARAKMDEHLMRLRVGGTAHMDQPYRHARPLLKASVGVWVGAIISAGQDAMLYIIHRDVAGLCSAKIARL